MARPARTLEWSKNRAEIHPSITYFRIGVRQVFGVQEVQWIFKVQKMHSVLRTCRDSEHEQTGKSSGGKKSTLRKSTTAGQDKQDEGTSWDFDQPKHKLGQVEVCPQPGHAQWEAIIHQHIHKPDDNGDWFVIAIKKKHIKIQYLYIHTYTLPDIEQDESPPSHLRCSYKIHRWMTLLPST